MAAEPYRLFVSREFIASLEGYRRADRQRVWRWLDTVVDRPHQEGDFTERDGIGRRLEVTVIGRLCVTWWADHAVKEIKVLEIGLAD